MNMHVREAGNHDLSADVHHAGLAGFQSGSDALDDAVPQQKIGRSIETLRRIHHPPAAQ
jgi:hypothetical protein